MGKIKQGILGGFSGKVAGVVGSSWKGIAVIKAKPLSVANPNTAGQVAQRSKFRSTIAFAVMILSTIIKPLWDRFSIQMSGYNAFIRANMACFDATGLINPGALKISSGQMAATACEGGAMNDGDLVATLDYPNDAGNGYKLATDKVYAVAYNVTQGRFATSVAVEARSDMAVDLEFTDPVSADDVIHYWLAFKRADGTIVSDTSYHTRTVL